ncbi:hypothetical protein B0H16DRAFT_1618095 [Mycena metata]|uniref:Uncharacterized protein n=1 Tax=Mycena metata TaxID=1033252 RepID=A0AAD7MFV2_9AGAR|nr:hypothetical protein B0H16DRAFT_1618095 [Mycena metata]
MLSVQVVLVTLFLHASAASADDLTPGFPNMTAFSGSINPPVGCVTIPVPAEYVCTYFQNLGCLAVEDDDHSSSSHHTILPNGTWNMLNVPTASGTQNFNDLTSSFNCVRSDGAASDR